LPSPACSTFTNKAAGEMAGRIRATLGDAAAPYWIATFHGLERLERGQRE
jgi:superfamily I DNA/RNA helicase